VLTLKKVKLPSHNPAYERSPNSALPQCCSPGRVDASWKVCSVGKQCFWPHKQDTSCPTTVWVTENILLGKYHSRKR